MNRIDRLTNNLDWLSEQDATFYKECHDLVKEYVYNALSETREIRRENDDNSK